MTNSTLFSEEANIINVSDWYCPPSVCHSILRRQYNFVMEFSRKFLSYDESKFWGAYFNLFESNEMAQTPVEFTDAAPKRIDRLLIVDPRTELLLSIHHHKVERWVSLDGNASFNAGSEPKNLQRQRLRMGEVVVIEAGTIHNLINETNEVAVIYEIQTGFCSDHDVVRL